MLSILIFFFKKKNDDLSGVGGIRTHNLDNSELQLILEKALEKVYLTPELSGIFNVVD